MHREYTDKHDRYDPCPLETYRLLGKADSIKVRSIRKKEGASCEYIKGELTNCATKSITVKLKCEKMNRSS